MDKAKDLSHCSPMPLKVMDMAPRTPTVLNRITKGDILEKCP